MVPSDPLERGIAECEARVRGYRMRYLRAGQGPALVLLHGLLGYSFSWRFNIPILARSFTVYAPDVVGMGFSDRPAGLDCSLRACAERITAWIEQLGVESLNLLGTSHGGAIACLVAADAIARTRPRIEKLVLVDAVNPWSRGGRKRIAAFSNPVGATAFRIFWPPLKRYTTPYFLRRMYGDPGKVTQAALNGYRAGLAQPLTAEYALGVVKSWRRDVRQLIDVYQRIQGIPTQLIWGDRDLAVTPDSAYRLQQALPGSELVMLPGVGHLPYEEAPEEFNRVVLKFLGRAQQG